MMHNHRFNAIANRDEYYFSLTKDWNFVEWRAIKLHQLDIGIRYMCM